MSASQRDEARTSIRQIIDFCLNETLNPDGSFKMMDEDTLGSSFMFPVSVLDEAGYFRRSRRFWTYGSFPGSTEVARRIEAKMKSVGLNDTESSKTIRKLEWIQREAMFWKSISITAFFAAGIVFVLLFRKRAKLKMQT